MNIRLLLTAVVVALTITYAEANFNPIQGALEAPYTVTRNSFNTVGDVLDPDAQRYVYGSTMGRDGGYSYDEDAVYYE